MLIQLIGKVYNFHIVSAPIERRLTIYVKHMVAIFQIIKDISWESLPEAYFDHIFYKSTLDTAKKVFIKMNKKNLNKSC